MEQLLGVTPAFAQTWDAEFPTISKAWREHWAHLTPFFAFPQDIRRVIYTTNAIESLNSTLRKINQGIGTVK